MRILFLDDQAARFEIFKTRFTDADTLVFAQTVGDAANHLTRHIHNQDHFDIISFDHDLFDPALKAWINSQGLATWFVTNCPKERAPQIFIIHSINDSGSWALYHIFMKLCNTWRSPFRLENRNEYELAAKIGSSMELEGS